MHSVLRAAGGCLCLPQFWPSQKQSALAPTLAHLCTSCKVKLPHLVKTWNWVQVIFPLDTKRTSCHSGWDSFKPVSLWRETSALSGLGFSLEMGIPPMQGWWGSQFQRLERNVGLTWLGKDVSFGWWARSHCATSGPPSSSEGTRSVQTWARMTGDALSSSQACRTCPDLRYFNNQVMGLFQSLQVCASYATWV
jgi:hypothetical protein